MGGNMDKKRLSLAETCERLKITIPAALECAKEEKLELWVTLFSVNVFSAKFPNSIPWKQITLKPGIEFFSVLERLELGDGLDPVHFLRSFDITSQKVHGTYQKPKVWTEFETIPALMSYGPTPRTDYGPGCFLAYDALRASNDQGHVVVVTSQSEGRTLEMETSSLFAYLEDVERFEKELEYASVYGWSAIAKRLLCSDKTAQNMDDATGNKYVTRPGKSAGRGQQAFATGQALDQMKAEYDKNKK